MPLLHFSNHSGWKREITRLIDDKAYRSELERDIAEKFNHRNWEMFCIDFCRDILTDV